MLAKIQYNKTRKIIFKFSVFHSINYLFVVLNRRFKHSDVIVSFNIFVKSVIPSFRMSHLSYYSSVRRCYALDCKRRIVWIKSYIIRRISANFAISSSEAINLPSPWEIGTVYTSSGCVFISHGDLFDAILVLTILD